MEVKDSERLKFDVKEYCSLHKAGQAEGPSFIIPEIVLVVWTPKKFSLGHGYTRVLKPLIPGFPSKYKPINGNTSYLLPNPNAFATLSTYIPAQLITYFASIGNWLVSTTVVLAKSDFLKNLQFSMILTPCFSQSCLSPLITPLLSAIEVLGDHRYLSCFKIRGSMCLAS